MVVLDTLLGPEETGQGAGPLTRCCSRVAVLLLVGRCFLVCRANPLSYRFMPLGVGVWWWVGLVVCLLFVNCIVDASIFVAKFFRAHGGCLGIRSR